MLNNLMKPIRVMAFGVSKSLGNVINCMKVGVNRITRINRLSKRGSNPSLTNLVKKEILNKVNINEEQLKNIMPTALTNSQIIKKKKFKSILIANRGEIALRIIRACRELGIKAYIIYTKHDKDSLAVKYADKSYCIGNAGISYLNTKKILSIAKKTNAEAIHPGYGFLAENHEFAKLCENNNIKFIGPSSGVISLLGDKVKAREVMHKTGIPIIGGTNRLLRDDNDAIDVANKLGYPVILKASSGGGGKGVRIVNNEQEMSKAFESAEQEALTSFGVNGLYIEKYIEAPRHIEFQILGDKYGNILHLGERECSIQRRYQKLIEESPSSAITPELREKMGNLAIKIAKDIGYEGAGTVEFLLDRNNNFYFIEMNTRIQVEHGITEMVTGIDLVKEQIKIAYGTKLRYAQGEIKINGFAIECRINAECPKEGFCPSIGTITNYLPPGGPGIRICSSSHRGQVVSPQYDSLIAKLMCSGKTRKEAIARMKRALDEYVIEGINTTIGLHKVILREKDFVKGNIDTHFIESHNIIEKISKDKSQKKEITKTEKMLIITTAVSKYIDEKGLNNSNAQANPWVTAARQEMMNEG